MVIYKELSLIDIQDDFLSTFNRYQETQQVMVQQQGHLITKDDSFIDDWDYAKKSFVIQSLRSCIYAGGIVIGVFRELQLIAFANVERTRFGTNNDYVELSYIHVSHELRGGGIGKQLFAVCCVKAKQLGARKLYIAAHPSIETHHFYERLGCMLAIEINTHILSKEPLDLQMERLL